MDMPTSKRPPTAASTTSPTTATKTAVPTALERRHQGFTIRKYRDLPTSDGLAFSCEIMLNGKCVGNAEDNGNGGGAFVYFIDREMERQFLGLSHLHDSNGSRLAGTTEDIVLLLIGTVECERISKKNTVLRSEPVKDDLNMRAEFRLKGRATAEELRRSPVKTTPPVTQMWEPGEGWIVITTGEAFF
jgi:hypothetical protein